MTLEVVGVWVLVVLIVLLVALLIAQDMIISKRDGRFAGTRYADRPKASVAAAPSDELMKMINDVHRYTLAEVRAQAELDAYPLEGEPVPGGADMPQQTCPTCGNVAGQLPCRHYPLIKPCEMPQLDAQLTARAVARLTDQLSLLCDCGYPRCDSADLPICLECGHDIAPDTGSLIKKLAAQSVAMTEEQRRWYADLATRVKRTAELEAEASALLGRLVDSDRRVCDPPRL